MPDESDWKTALSRDEIRELLEVRDLRGWLSLLANWAIVGASFAMVAWSPNPFTVVLALFLIGGRQLGFSVIMHEAAHRSLLRRRASNDWVGNWLAAYPVWTDLAPYRHYHLRHHARNWTADDPDLDLVAPFPITRASLKRKIWRDLSGQTGWKRARAIIARDAGNFHVTRPAGKTERAAMGWQNFGGVIVTNAFLFGALAAFGYPALYLLWVVAWFTTYSLIMRIRAIAEHALAPDPADPLKNARTTLASWWERLFLCPNRVNYHLEHHLLMTVPHYNLPRLHRLLRERGALDDAWISPGYLQVLREASSKAEPSPVLA